MSYCQTISKGRAHKHFNHMNTRDICEQKHVNVGLLGALRTLSSEFDGYHNWERMLKYLVYLLLN